MERCGDRPYNRRHFTNRDLLLANEELKKFTCHDF